MSQSAAERLAQRRTTRPMPSFTVAREGEPAVSVTKTQHSQKRRNQINTPITDDAYAHLELLTSHLRSQHGRSWRQNSTIELALSTLANHLNLSRDNKTT